MPGMTTRRLALAIHRWLSLSVALLWLLQAFTGLFAVFHWEVDDATVRGVRRPLDFVAMERAVGELAPAGSGRRVASLWTTAASPNRYDVTIEAEAPGRSEAVRIDGAGGVLRRRTDGERWADGGWVDTLVTLHHNFLAGDLGSWIVGVSGALLVSNIGLGVWAAWPRAGAWRRALRPPSRGPASAKLHDWHRAVGLWAAAPAGLTVSAGVLLVFAGPLERLVAPTPEAPTLASTAPRTIGLARAVAIARERHSDAVVSGVRFPSAGDATWSLRLRLPGEAIRAYGESRVAVSALDGRVTQDMDARRAAPSRWAYNHLFAFHTGEIAGPLGRAAVFALGLWLVSMICLGVSLWAARRSLAKTPGRALHDGPAATLGSGP